MVKYHINGKGEAGKCTATQGGCPFGGESEHFTSAAAARKSFEQSMETTLHGTKVPASMASAFGVEEPKAPQFNSISSYEYDKSIKKIERFYAKDESRSINMRVLRDSSVREIEKARSDEAQLIKDRFAAAKKSGAKGSVREVVESGLVNEASPKAELRDAERYALAGVAYLSPQTREKLHELPVSFVPALASTHAEKRHSDQGLQKLVDMAAAVRAKDPTYEPRGFNPPPRITGRVADNGMKQMQNISPEAYGVMKTYVEQKYGENARKFWSTVNSDSSNYPKLSDFARAEREFDKLQSN